MSFDQIFDGLLIKYLTLSLSPNGNFMKIKVNQPFDGAVIKYVMGHYQIFDGFLSNI